MFNIIMRFCVLSRYFGMILGQTFNVIKMLFSCYCFKGHNLNLLHF